MRSNLTVYTLTASVAPFPTGSVAMDPTTASPDPLLTPFSSSQHEVTRLNAMFVGKEGNETSTNKATPWRSISGRSANTTSGQYDSASMITPSSMRNLYYAKNYTTGTETQRFTKYVYVVNATTSATIPGASSSYITPASGAAESTYDPRYGRLIDANQWDTFKINIPVGMKGKIRDVKVWVELVHRNRSGDVNSGLGGLQIALQSPNVNFAGAYPLWNAPGAPSFLYDANPSVTGVDGIVNGAFNTSVPEIFSSGAYVLWDGHGASPALNYASQSLGITNDGHEFDSDIDMRAVFTDSSSNRNPRSRILVFPSATEGSPGMALDLSATLIYGLKPLSYYWSPSNFAQRFYSGTFVWGGASASLSGAVVPWYVDPNLKPGLMTKAVQGAPPAGWLTGDPSSLIQPWIVTGQSVASASLWAVCNQQSGSYPYLLPGTNLLGNVSQDLSALSGTSVVVTGFVAIGDRIFLQDALTASLTHSAIVTRLTTALRPTATATMGSRLITPPTASSNGGAPAPASNLVYKWLSNPLNGFFYDVVGQVGFAPPLPVSFNAAGLKIYAANGVKYTTGSALDSGRLFYPGYAIGSDTPGTIYYQYRSNYILAPYVGLTSTLPSPGQYISAFGRILPVAAVYRGMYINGFPGTGYWQEGPYDAIYFDTGATASMGLVTTADAALTGTSTVKIATPGAAIATSETALNDYGLGPRYQFSYGFKQANQLMLIGGYSGSITGGAQNGYVDILYFSGTSIVSGSRSGSMTLGTRGNGALFAVQPAPFSSTFYVLVGGGISTTWAINTASSNVYSTATVVSAAYSAPYSYKYWTTAELYGS